MRNLKEMEKAIIKEAVQVQGLKMYNDLMRMKAEKKNDKVTAEWYVSKIGAQMSELMFLEGLIENYGGSLMNYYGEMKEGKIRFYRDYIGMVDSETAKTWQKQIDEFYSKAVG